MITRLRTSLWPDDGASAVEYARLIALIAGVIVLAVVFFGQQVKGKFVSTGSCISQMPAC